MKAAGFTASQMRAADFTASQMRAAGFTASQMKAADFTASQMKAADFTASQMKAAGFTASQMKAADFTASQMKAADFTASQMKAAGFTASQIKAAGFAQEEGDEEEEEEEEEEFTEEIVQEMIDGITEFIEEVTSSDHYEEVMKEYESKFENDVMESTGCTFDGLGLQEQGRFVRNKVNELESIIARLNYTEDDDEDDDDYRALPAGYDHARVAGFSSFDTATLPGATLKGKIYYEVALIHVGICPQIGWATSGFTPGGGKGVGDDAVSWGADGARVLLWHKGLVASLVGSRAWSIRWKDGDIIGCAADLELGQLWFGRNGVWSLAFEGCSSKWTEGLYPAVSGQRMTFAINSTPQFPGPSPEFRNVGRGLDEWVD